MERLQLLKMHRYFERVVREDVFTSLHMMSIALEVRDTKREWKS